MRGLLLETLPDILRSRSHLSLYIVMYWPTRRVYNFSKEQMLEHENAMKDKWRYMGGN